MLPSDLFRLAEGGHIFAVYPTLDGVATTTVSRGAWAEEADVILADDPNIRVCFVIGLIAQGKRDCLV